MPIVQPSQIKNKFWKNPNFLFKPSSNCCAFMLTNQIKSRGFLIVSIFMCFCPFGSSWIGLKMALVSVLSEILQRPTIVWCVKQVDNVHSAFLGSGSCQGFGWVGMEAQMGQCFFPKILFQGFGFGAIPKELHRVQLHYTYINFYHFHFITLTF